MPKSRFKSALSTPRVLLKHNSASEYCTFVCRMCLESANYCCIMYSHKNLRDRLLFHSCVCISWGPADLGRAGLGASQLQAGSACAARVTHLPWTYELVRVQPSAQGRPRCASTFQPLPAVGLLPFCSQRRSCNQDQGKQYKHPGREWIFLNAF